MAVDKFTASDGIGLAYYIDDYTDPWRKADTLLLLHAAVGSARRFYGWVPALCRHYRVVRLDLRGHGASGIPPASSPLKMDRLVADVSELLDHLDAEPAHIVGNSAGGYLGAESCDDQSREGQEPDAVRLDARAAEQPGGELAAAHRHGRAAQLLRRRRSPTVCRSTRYRPDSPEWFVDEAAKNDPAWITRFVGLMSTLDWSDRLARDQVSDPHRHAGRRDGRLDQEL